MNALIQRLNAPDDFVVLGFPCNQFNQQEPALNEEIMNCLQYVRPGENFIPAFELTQKMDVNGDDEHPLWTFLKGNCANPSEIIGSRSLFRWETLKQSDITWNFEKFLIDREGKPYRRYAPSIDPLDLENDILDLIGSKEKDSDQVTKDNVMEGVEDEKDVTGLKNSNEETPKQKHIHQPSLASIFLKGRKRPVY
jgi:glutathione peroxidase